MSRYIITIESSASETIKTETVKCELDRVLNVAQRMLYNTPEGARALVQSTRFASLTWEVSR